jgi:ATP-dependent helicase/nuclease subunit A
MNMIFNASAGTGKTYQVTELYTALVLGTYDEKLLPVAPEKILLMTFTDNAAAELRHRVSEKLIAAEDENDLARSVLRRLPTANISTIHAFCASVLREHALEVGLSPTFQTLENEERDDLLDDVLKAEIFQGLETDKNFRKFCAGLSILGDHDTSVLKTIRSLLDKAASRGLDLSDAEQMLPENVPTIGKGDFQKIYDELEPYDLPATAAKALDALKRFLSDFPNLGNLEAVRKFGQAKKVKHLSDALAEIKEQFINETRYAENIEPFRAFARCLARCSFAFAEAKRARDCVDFGDQLLLARDLLAGGVESSFEWIIVDEVQDTSRVQCDVIRSLWSEKTNLVICGDKKQSIYAWRSADPDVMPDLEKAMAERGTYDPITLKDSYRSKQQVVDAVNALFEPLYESYDALEPLNPLLGEGPCVEFLDADDEEQGTAEEMAAVARRIQALVNGGDEWRPKFGYYKKTKKFVEGESFRYGDILILLKRSTHQRILEDALREAGIAYTSGGKGKALFEQQEVRDLLLFLQVIAQPHNDLALLGFLRSPFAGLTDDEIVQLGWDGETLDRKILRAQFFETEKAELVLRYRAQAGEKLASQLIRDVVRETAFDAYLAGQPGGEQKLANFKKALDWIRNAERGGQVLLGDVVRRFEKAIKTPPSSGAAEAMLPNPEQDAVTIMTVHGAKGLTKRVCFVPDISFGGTSDKAFAVFGEKSLELKLRGLTSEEIVSPGWKVARDADKRVRDAESLNVFYVAMTRARDLVVLSGAGTKDSKGWKKDAEEFLQNATPELLRTIRFSELPPIGNEDFRPEALGFGQDVEFQPLEIPKGFERKPVTSLVEARKPKAHGLKTSGDRRSLGTLGHEILEELALNGWDGEIPELEDEVLARQLVAARDALREETAGAEAVYAEFPFVLKRDDVILDGAMDLLVQFSEGWKIYDYKFSDASPEDAIKKYSPQLQAYTEAVEMLYPDTVVLAELVLIGQDGTRFCPMNGDQEKVSGFTKNKEMR